MKLWIMTVAVLFCLVELYQWIKGFMLPLPVYVLAGAFLSVASNYDKEIGTFWKQRDNRAETLSQTAILDDSKAVLAAKQDSLTALEGNQE